MVLLGLIVGSFLNVVIHRLPVMMEREWRQQCAELMGQDTAAKPAVTAAEHFNLWSPRSRCPHCGHLIRAIENIPLLSFLWQRGRCRHCHARISWRYPLVELLAGIVGGVAASHFGFGVPALACAVMGWTLIALAFIDLDHYLLPDDITLSMLWLGIALNFTGLLPVGLYDSVGGAILGYVSLWSVYWLFKIVTGREGMGYGDFKLLAALGAWMGWKLLPLVIVLASAVGAVLGIAAIVLVQRDRRKPIPFGPYLACAGWIAMLYGQELTAAYLQWAMPL
ncbi:MAG TPA: A24 family peptidase [Gammaproteobacteria bacterium]|nr:A24 family peptidase [Gammaproteobacteria bacterium]